MGKAKMNNSEMNSAQVGSKEGEEAVDKHKSNDTSKLSKGHRRRPTRSQSMGPSTTSQQVAEKETSESKRRCLRRQSARFKSQQHEPIENLFEIEDAKFVVGHDPMCEESPTPLSASIRKEDNNENCAPGFDAREPQRTSLGRPLRRAVEKVQSYKEIPLNIKMRRSE